MKITFDRRKPRIDDWAVRANGIAYGSLWRSGADYLVIGRAITRAADRVTVILP